MSDKNTQAEMPSMTLEQAMKLAGLWSAGKMIGGDPYEVIEVLYAALSHQKAQALENDIKALLWGEHPECCGSPVVGATYYDQQEMVCCGCPEPTRLSDAQIVMSLRSMFPETGDKP